MNGRQTMRRLVRLLGFLVLVFGVALLVSWIGTSFFNESFSSIYVHACIGIVAGFVVFFNPLAGLGLIYLLIAYQDEQTREGQGDGKNASDIAGYVIGFSTVLLLHALYNYFMPELIVEQARRVHKV
jgi:hypothetical protein